MTPIDPIEVNHQIFYLHPMNAMGASMNLLTFGHSQFARMTLVKEIDLVKKFCEEFSPTEPPSINEIAPLAIDQLMNSIRLTICFENLMKAILLLDGYMIYKLSKDHFPVLYKEQFKRPITIFEILERKNWEENKSLNLNPPQFNLQIKGVTKLTMGMRELTSKNYLKVYNINDEILRICKPYFAYRNNLHLYMQEKFSLGRNTYKDITQLIDFVNNHLTRIHDDIIDKTNKGSSYYLPKIDYA